MKELTDKKKSYNALYALIFNTKIDLRKEDKQNESKKTN